MALFLVSLRDPGLRMNELDELSTDICDVRPVASDELQSRGKGYHIRFQATALAR